jgi:hypothetical protein
VFLKLTRHFVLCESHSLAFRFNRENGIVNQSHSRLRMSFVLTDSPLVYIPFTWPTLAIFFSQNTCVGRKEIREAVSKVRTLCCCSRANCLPLSKVLFNVSRGYDLKKIVFLVTDLFREEFVGL